MGVAYSAGFCRDKIMYLWFIHMSVLFAEKKHSRNFLEPRICFLKFYYVTNFYTIENTEMMWGAVAGTLVECHVLTASAVFLRHSSGSSSLGTAWWLCGGSGSRSHSRGSWCYSALPPPTHTPGIWKRMNEMTWPEGRHTAAHRDAAFGHLRPKVIIWAWKKNNISAKNTHVSCKKNPEDDKSTKIENSRI